MTPTISKDLGSILPRATRLAIQKVAPKVAEEKAFRSNIALPKGANRHLVARGVDRVIFQGIEVEQATRGFTRSEKQYVEDVVAEYTAWKSAESQPSGEQSPVSVEPVLIGAEAA